MTLLRVIVVDDENLARDYLRSIITSDHEVECVASCSSGREALAQIRQHKPDVVFLDIEMPETTGFDVVKALQPDELPLVIFATAFEDYAIKAFEVQAVDYILKPFHPERVRQALLRARERLSGDNDRIDEKHRYIAAMDNIEPENNKASPAKFESNPARLAIKSEDTIILVPYDDISWIDAAGDYMCVHVDGTTHILRCTMKELEQKLANTRLTRIHRSTLVNLDHVQSIKPLPKGECELFLKHEVVLKVSRSYRKNIEQLRQ